MKELITILLERNCSLLFLCVLAPIVMPPGHFPVIMNNNVIDGAGARVESLSYFLNRNTPVSLPYPSSGLR